MKLSQSVILLWQMIRKFLVMVVVAIVVVVIVIIIIVVGIWHMISSTLIPIAGAKLSPSPYGMNLLQM